MGREKKKTVASYGRDPFTDMDDFPVAVPPADNPTASSNSVAPVATNGGSEKDQSSMEATGPDFPWSAGEETATMPPPAPPQKRARKRRKQAQGVDQRPVESTVPTEPLSETVPEPIPMAQQAEPAPQAKIDSAATAAAPEDTGGLLDELIASVDQESGESGAEALAETLVPTKAGTGPARTEQYIIFSLADTEYATLLTNVTEIGRPSILTPVPNVPEWVLGVTNLRGDIVSIVDLRRLLQVSDTGLPPEPQLLLARTQQQDITTGLIVDRVNGVRFLPADQIKPPTAPLGGHVASYLRGVYEYEGHLLVVLDLDRLLLSPEMRQFETV